MEGKTIVVARDDAARAVLGAAALALIQLGGNLLQQAVFPVVVAAQPLIREAQSFVGLAFALFLVLACMRRPSLLHMGRLTAGSFAGLVASALLLVLGQGSVWALGLGCSLLAVAGVWASCLCGVVLGRIGSRRVLSCAIAAGLIGGIACSSAARALGYAAGAVGMVLVEALALAMLWGQAAPVVRDIASGQASRDLALANPRSFLGPTHQIFVLAFVFSLASQLSVALCHDVGFAADDILTLAITVGFGLWFALGRAPGRREDTLFDASSLLVLGGMVIVVLDQAIPGAVSHGLLSAGNQCYLVLSWLVVARLCERNPSGSLYAVSLQAAAQGAGVLAGATVGHACSALGATDAHAAGLLLAALLLCYVAYVQLGLRNFSFSDAIAGLEPAVPVPDAGALAPAPSRDEALSVACARLASAHALTAREADVVALLCRGYSGKRIQDELALGYNTVKTHAKHAYRKLDVHSQQELIDLVEATAGMAQGDGHKASSCRA